MQSLWNDEEAARYSGDLALRVYTSRLLGRDPSLVLHGGGNTSVKIRETNLVGEAEDILYVKGSGWDLATIEAAGFSPVRMPHLLKLAKLEVLSDPQMANELKTQMTRADAPAPSVETILHATLPYKYVDHTHADAVVTITNTANGKERIEEIYGDRVVIIPYIMPGFDLARLCAREFTAAATEKTIGMVLMNHGIFSFGETARESYERMIELVSLAEDYLTRQGAILETVELVPEEAMLRYELVQLRQELSQAAGFPVIVTCDRAPETLAFARRDDIATISQQGPATPDHVIRTKRIPMLARRNDIATISQPGPATPDRVIRTKRIPMLARRDDIATISQPGPATPDRIPSLGRDVAAYCNAYQDYFKTHATPDLTQLDPIPRVILDAELGMVTVGKTAKDAAIVADIYHHTIEIIDRATKLGGYKALSPKELFAVEYWDLEQAKLRKGGKAPMFLGEIALVTGAASGIGKACVASLLQRGAVVVGLDINPAIETLYQRPDYCGICCDITEETAIEKALETAVRNFGGIDILILNAGIFPPARAIAELSIDEWHKVTRINLDANLILMRECYPFLKLAPQGGKVVAIGSKNVPAPGPGVAAYSASKAALNQLMRVAALEWGKDNIRLNSVHPNAVFDTGIWTEEVLEKRAQHYGLTVEDYKTNNVLKVEITSESVAELVAELCGPLFGRTTGAQIPIDGGNERVI